MERRRLIDKDDLFRFRFIRSARLSPNGTRVAYVVSQTDAVKEEETSAVFVMDLVTGQQRKFTTGLACDMGTEWSPDGQEIAFVSTRMGAPQLFVIPADGGEARQFTSLRRGVSGAPRWSPDGRWIAFTSGGNAEPRDPSRPYRVTRSVYRFDGMGYLDDAVQHVFVIPSGGGEPRCLDSGRYQKALRGWSPDSKHVLYQASLFPDSFEVMNGCLYSTDLRGNVRKVVSNVGASPISMSGTWAMDGSIIVEAIAAGARQRGTKKDLWVVSGPDAEPECRTSLLAVGIGDRLIADMPFEATAAILTTDQGRAAYVAAQRGGAVEILRVSLQGPEEWATVVTGDRSCFPLDLQANRMLYLVSDLNTPGDLYVCDLDGSNERRLTTLNDALLESLYLPTIESHQFVSPDGALVEGFLARPPLGNPPFPTILYIHGGPYAAFGHVFHFDTQMLCGAGYAVLMVNHRPSTGYGSEFSVAIDKNWGVKDFQDLMAGVDGMVEMGLSDPRRLGVCGTSGGGNLTCWIVGQTDRFKAAVAENPITNWMTMFGTSDIGVWFSILENGGQPHEVPESYIRQSPITYAHRCRTPTLLIQAEVDYRCPAEQSEQFYAALKANGCQVEMIRMPNSYHGGSVTGPVGSRKAQNDGLLGWMNRYVLGKTVDSQWPQAT